MDYEYFVTTELMRGCGLVDAAKTLIIKNLAGACNRNLGWFQPGFGKILGKKRKNRWFHVGSCCVASNGPSRGRGGRPRSEASLGWPTLAGVLLMMTRRAGPESWFGLI